MVFSLRKLARTSLHLKLKPDRLSTLTRTLGNTAVALKKRPEADQPVALDDFTISVTDVELEKADIVAKTLYLSVDPYMRCRFNSDTGVDYVKPFAIGSPVTSAAVSISLAIQYGRNRLKP